MILMVKTYKFGEESKLISFRVPQSKSKLYREKIQKYIDYLFETNRDPLEDLTFLKSIFERELIEIHTKKLTNEEMSILDEI